MKDVRRMSVKEAGSAALKQATEFLADSGTNGYVGQLLEPAPDVTRTENIGKVPRHWTVAVEWTLNGNIVDGPSVIRLDLLERTSDWL
ncbi:MAG: hypothetical protein ACK5TH_05730 [Prosthecobacter sp.]